MATRTSPPCNAVPRATERRRGHGGHNSLNASTATSVGGNAPSSKPSGLIAPCVFTGFQITVVAAHGEVAVFQLEDVDDGAAAVARAVHRVHVQDHVVAVDEAALDLAVRLREFLAQHGHVLAKAFPPVRRIGVVLHVAVAHVLQGGIGVLLVQAFFIKGQHTARWRRCSSRS